MTDETSGSWLDPKPVQPLVGDEPFGDSGFAVTDFWRWAFSDLRENILRGVLAEFLVAKAVGDPSPLRHAWDNYDVTTMDGTRIEVKSSAYLQSWRQKAHSRITFSGLTGRAWSHETNELDAHPSLRADVYVFALHNCREPDQYDPLDLGAWEFYVLSVETLREAGSPKSVSLAFLDRVGAGAVDYAGLPAAVQVARP
jgi:hypothetical protein